MQLVFDDGHEATLELGQARRLINALWEAAAQRGSVSAAAAIQYGLGRTGGRVELDARESIAADAALHQLADTTAWQRTARPV